MRNVTRTLRTLMLLTVSMFFFVTSGLAQQTVLLNESFESGNGATPPAGWALEQVSGTTLGISFVTSSTNPTINAAYDGTKFVRYNAYNITSGQSTRLKNTTAMSTVNKSFIMVEFAWYEDPGYSTYADKVDVQWSTNGTSWTTAATYNRYNAVAGWKSKNVILPSGANGQTTLYVGFLFTSAFGNNCSMDMVKVTAGPAAPPAFVTVGTGTTTVGYPYYTFYMGSRTQMLYTAAELTSAGGSAGNFLSVGLNVSTAYPQVMQNFTIKMGHTTSSTLTGWVTTGMNTVYQVNYGVPGTGWRDITLTTPFAWNGTSNVVVEICFGDNGSYTSNSLVMGSANTGQTWHYHADYYAGCTGTSAGAVQTTRPNIRFGTPPVTPGALMGYVKDINTLQPIAGAIVMVGTKRDTSRANGFYIIYNLPSGAVTANATATGYISGSASGTITAGQATSLDVLMAPGPKVGGTITDASTGAPIIGATVTVGGVYQTMSVTGGVYLTPLLSVSGNNVPIVIGKTGYDDLSGTVNLVPNTTATFDASLLPTAVPPGPFTAALNGTPGTAVNLNWGVPQGMYQQIYDDGIQDNFAIWANANNLNALKFTALAYPVKLIGGKVNLGVAANYPANALPLLPFKMMAYKADGPNGVPGNVIDSVEVTPNGFGWADFTFASPITINSGDFYLVMKQGGIPPHAAGLGIDLTNVNLRSYSKFVTGNGPWVPAAGTFMMRAILQGTGGPIMNDAPVAKQIITANAVEGLTYEMPIASQTGYEGTATYEAIEWSELQNTNVAPQVSVPVITGQAETDQGVGSTVTTGTVIPTDAPAALLFDNGSMITNTGTGFGGADESLLQTPLTSYGTNFNKAAFYKVADDFTVTGNPWNVSSIEFYGYQTGSTTTSTFTAAYCRIFNGNPSLPGSTVIWGDTTTNRLSSTSFTNIYRVSVTGNNQRPIMKLVMNTTGLTLPAGTYWIEFSALGSLASGPWCPYVTILNTPVTGNGLVAFGTTYSPLNATYGQGVPFKINGTQATSSNMSYQVWRLKQGEEGNQAVWTSIYTGNVNQTTDNSWPTLACAPYRWAVKAIYSPPGTRPSPPTFSNILEKCWRANVNVCVSLTCLANPKAGTLVKLVNTNYPDTVYTQTTDTSGCVHFTNVYKGTYAMTVTRFTYPIYTQNVTIMGDANYNVTLLQTTQAPSNLTVNDQTLKATWNPPRTMVYQLNEDFTGGFATNQWTTSGGSNFSVSTATGNPAPSATFSWSPQVTNYNQYLTSKSLAGIHAPQMQLKYDIFLDNFGSTYLNSMAVELWNGTTWTVLKTYDNSSGANIPWTSETLDITSQTHNPAFQVRFHAFGQDTYDIDGWYIDNVKVVSGDGNSGPNPCVIGYNFYLNGVLSAFTPDTTYNIPPNQVVYGQTYNACVKAVYASGYSQQICYSFIAKFLYPARNLSVEGVECNAYLTWQKPVTMGDAPGDNQAYAPKTSNQPAADISANGGSAMIPQASVRLSDGIDATNAILFDNGPLVNSPGTGAGGADESVLLSPLGTYGFGAQQSASNTMADDFIVPAGGWSPTKFTFYTYQTGAPTTGTITGLYFRIYNGDPTAGGTVIWGDMTTNRMTFQGWSNIYRTQAVGGATDRAIMKVEATVSGLTLPQGVYWVEFQFNGSGSSGPWAPPITITGTPGTGNGKQNQAGTWVNAMDGSYQQGLPFIIEGPGSGGGGQTPAGLIGYNIYRGGNFIHYNPHPDSITYWDYNLNPGTYKYDVKAKYDLTPYGFAGQFGESLTNTAGEQTIEVSCGAPLPFYEPWNQGSFTFNEWAPSGHWTINTGIGNPAPSADFHWDPEITNYSQALVSQVIDASDWTCAKIWLDFDVKLMDRNATGKEKLTIDIQYGGSWHQKMEISNNGSTNWVAKHIDISAVKGKAFRVRFVASGENSSDMLHWYVDNIHAYGICNPAKSLTASQSQFTTTLNWVAPECVTTVPTVLVKLFQHSNSPDNGYYQYYNRAYGVVYDLATYPDASLNKLDYHHASWGTTGIWQYKIHVVDWTTYTEIATLGPLTTTGDDKWETNIPLGNIAGVGGKMIGIMLEPLSNSSTDAYPCFSADNVGPDGVSVFGDLPNYSAFATSAIGDFLQNLYIEVPAGDGYQIVQPNKVAVGKPAGTSATRIATGNKPSPDYLITNQVALTVNESDSSILSGYNVYRTDATGANFAKLNSTPLSATTYVDTYPTSLESGNFYYYVTTMYKGSSDNNYLPCEPSSDTIFVKFPATGINELTNGEVTIFPNPASEFVNVKSSYTINAIDVINYLGQSVYLNNKVDAKSARIDVSGYTPGVYFIKVSTSQGVRMVKTTIAH